MSRRIRRCRSKETEGGEEEEGRRASRCLAGLSSIYSSPLIMDKGVMGREGVSFVVSQMKEQEKEEGEEWRRKYVCE